MEFSLTHNRGCFGACNFCSIAFHQGRYITTRSHASLIREAEGFTKNPHFKGYIHDVGGPTADFRAPACQKQKTQGLCRDKKCLAPTRCPAVRVDHTDYVQLLRELRAIPGVKKVFVRSGLRYDYMMGEEDDTFLTELVRYHISGQLKVAPEHCSARVLDEMGKPHINVYEAFLRRPKGGEGAVSHPLPDEQPPRQHHAGRRGAGAVPEKASAPSPAGAGFLPHAGDGFHLYVLHRH